MNPDCSCLVSRSNIVMARRAYLLALETASDDHRDGMPARSLHLKPSFAKHIAQCLGHQSGPDRIRAAV